MSCSEHYGFDNGSETAVYALEGNGGCARQVRGKIEYIVTPVYKADSSFTFLDKIERLIRAEMEKTTE